MFKSRLVKQYISHPTSPTKTRYSPWILLEETFPSAERKKRRLLSLVTIDTNTTTMKPKNDSWEVVVRDIFV